MNPEIKEQWVKALRSGDYKQGQNVLRNKNDEFCCLGVLCDLAVKEGVIGEPSRKPGFDYYFYNGDDDWGGTKVLTLPVMEWAGLSDDNPDVRLVRLGKTSLAELNDENWTFQRIADVIEEQL